MYSKLKSRKKAVVAENATVVLPPKSADLEEYRGLSKTILKELEIYVCNTGKYKNRIILPIKYCDTLKAFETRAVSNDTQPKYLHSKGMSSKELIYPYNLIKEDYVVITEGIFDAIAMNDFGLCSITNWGIADNFSQKKIADLLELGVETIYISLDKDSKGQEAENKFFESVMLKEYFEVKSARNLKELNDYYKSDFKDFSDYYQTIKKD